MGIVFKLSNNAPVDIQRFKQKISSYYGSSMQVGYVSETVTSENHTEINTWYEEVSTEFNNLGGYGNVSIPTASRIPNGTITHKIKDLCRRYFAWYRPEIISNSLEFDFSELQQQLEDRSGSWTNFKIRAKTTQGETKIITGAMDIIEKPINGGILVHNGAKLAVEFDNINCDSSM